ncbi:MAG: RNA polymerase recycling motor ATPase HelR [Tessaracoccus sp.]
MSSAFVLSEQLAPKASPELISRDEEQFCLIDARLRDQISALSARLDTLRLTPAGLGQGALERDLEIHRVSNQLRILRTHGLDLCLGRIVRADGEHVYIGRIGLADAHGTPLLVDWRTPVAEPFFAATWAYPLGLISRRRYRWTGGRISDYWDEVFHPDGDTAPSMDGESAFLASLATSRSRKMRDVLSTIAADQDAIIRADARGTLVVDGGPGTGKTVVALHRAAYLMYADARIAHGGGGVLFIGPHRQYLDYADDVLPSLGEDRVQMCTLRDLVPEGATAVDEPDPAVARLKSRLDAPAMIEAAVHFYEEPPTTALTLSTPWGDATLTLADWAEAFDIESGMPHNDGRDRAFDAVLEILADQIPTDDEADPATLRRWLRRDEDLAEAFGDAWPVLDPQEVVADLWAVPAYLRLAAPALSTDERALLRRPENNPWTTTDLPLLDAARRRIGDPDAVRRRRLREAELEREAEERAAVADHLIAADHTEMQVMSMLRGADLRSVLTSAEDTTHDPLTGPFAHIIVDEAQELTDAEWRMLHERCPSVSFTVAGDRAQARAGFTGSWPERLAEAGLPGARVASLAINYRTPQEVMDAAELVIRAALPDANVPTSIRSSGIPIRHGSVDDLDIILDDWLATHDGIACVIGAPALTARPRVSSLTPTTAKGLEFDLVVLVDPTQFGAVDRYVSMTRATSQLVQLTS